MDTKRLVFYASHIKTLIWHYHYQSNVSKDSIDEFQNWLSCATPSGFTLLPAVRTIEFTEDDEYYGILYRFLCTPTLEELRFNANASAIEPILKHLVRSCPAFRNLHLSSPSSGHYFPPPAYDDHVLAPVVTQNLVRFTSGDSLTLGAVISFSKIPSLRHLSVTVAIEASQAFPPVGGPFFHALETLKFSVHRLCGVTLALVQAISSPILQQFTLSVQANSRHRLNERLVTQHTVALGRAPYKDTLRSVILFLKHTSASIPADTITVPVIQPLMSCRRLETLEVFADSAVLDLAACRFIACAFSHLDAFAFSDNSPGDRRDQGVGMWASRPFEFARAAPLEGLVAITKACRRLRSLHLSVRIESSDQLVLDQAAVLPTVERGLILPRYEDNDLVLQHLVDTYLGELLPRWPRPSQVTSIIPRAY